MPNLSVSVGLRAIPGIIRYDANGNAGQLVNAADGTLAAQYEYDPFGNTLAASGSEAENNPYRFSTKHFMPEFGWYDYGRRYYAPALGRWPTRDPIEEDGGLNLYGFVRNDPTNRFDYLGQFSEFIDCCPCQKSALASDEKRALQHIANLMNNINQAISQRPQKRITDTSSQDYGKFKDQIARRLEDALRVLRASKKKLPKCKVKCIKEDSGKYAMAFPWPLGRTIHIYEGETQELYWHLTETAQAATLVHETTHIAAATTDSEYFWQNGKGIKTQLFARWPRIASTYDTWILTGFCVPELNCPEFVVAPRVSRGGKECP